MRKLIATWTPFLLGALLVYSGGFKLLHPGTATFALVSLEFPLWAAVSAIVLVTAVELYLGVVLVWRVDLKFAIAGSVVLMFGFSCFLWYLSTLAHPPSCGCMGLTGVFESGKVDALFGLIRNCVILWALKITYDFRFRRVGGSGAAPQQKTVQCV